MAEKTKIVLAEDHTILREGLRSLLVHAGYLVVGEAEDGRAAILCVERARPDLVLLDISMPKMNGISAIKEIKSRYPDIKLLALTIHDSDEYIFEAFQLGVDGYCLKDASRDELLIAIDSVLEGKPYLSPGISSNILEGYLQEKRASKSGSPWAKITPREKDVLKLIGEGYKSKEIAEILFISPKTVEKHRSNIMKKLNLHNVSSLKDLAMNQGLTVENPV